jgi:short chain dehydrogenase
MFNNAGIAIGGDARDLTLDQWRRVLDVDLYGVLHGALAAYPIMVRQGSGHIVNTYRLQACCRSRSMRRIVRPNTPLSGSRAPCGLRPPISGVNVSVVCPGYVQANIYQNAVVVNLPQEATRQPAKMLSAAPAARSAGFVNACGSAGPTGSRSRARTPSGAWSAGRRRCGGAGCGGFTCRSGRGGRRWRCGLGERRSEGRIHEDHPGGYPAAYEAGYYLPDGDHLVPRERLLLVVVEPGVDVAAR